MAIEFNCPYCTAAIRVSDDAAGKVGRCPKCETRLRVPQPEPAGDTAVADSPPPTDSPAHTGDPPGGQPPPAGGQSEAPPEIPSPDAGEPLPQFPEVTEPEVPVDIPDATDVPGPIINTGDAAEPVYQRLTRERGRNWMALLGPVVCGGILVAAGFAYWWTQRETMTGDLSAERLPPDATRSSVIQRFVPDVSDDVWQASLTALREDPVVVQSELMVIEIRGSRRGLDITVSAGAQTDLVRVDVRRNRLLNQFYLDHGQDLDEARAGELKDAATRFLQDWHNATSAGMLMGNGQQYRDSVGLNALNRGLGYHSVALVGNTLYPCVHEDAEGWLYFVLPNGVDEFVVTEREIPEQDSVFPSEYRFTVRIAAPPPEPEEAEPPDEAVEEGSESDPVVETPMEAEEEMEAEESRSEQP